MEKYRVRSVTCLILDVEKSLTGYRTQNILDTQVRDTLGRSMYGQTLNPLDLLGAKAVRAGCPKFASS